MLPVEHWDQLGRALRGPRFRALAQSDPETHQFLSKVVAQPQLQDTLDELTDDADARKEATANPRGFLERRGIKVPADKHVIFRPEGSWFLGLVDSNGNHWGYEGGDGGRGFVCGK
jgi:hypothetical protein